MTNRYAVVFEKSRTSYGAYVPDLPGYVAAAPTLDETEKLIREAIDGDETPAATTFAEMVEITAA